MHSIMSNPPAETMKAVIFDGPFKISVQDRPIPTLQADSDIIVEVEWTALCGSELHVFRGIEKCDRGFIMGHEFTGKVIQTGSAVKSVKIGDRVVAPFTVSCGECFYCLNEHSSRCSSNLLFGSPNLDGGQAEYVRVPLADGSVMKISESLGRKAVLMADIFPTGYYGAREGFKVLPKEKWGGATVVVIGCGPVGLCAVIAALSFGPKHVFAVDSVESRLDLAKSLGAEPLNFMSDRKGMEEKVKEVTEGRGADIVIEVVGLSPALKTAYDLIRPFGVISSIGVHNGEIPWNGAQAYDKNLTIRMGRCPVRSVFPEALKLFEEKQDLFGFMFEKIMPLTQAVDAYDIFNKMQVQKVVFDPRK